MNKNCLLSFLPMAVLGVGLSVLPSCSSEEDPDTLIVDWAPVDISIMVQDVQGNDLLDSTNTSLYVAGGVTASFKGKTYELGSTQPKETVKKNSLKALPPEWNGFRIEKRKVSEADSVYMLVFGQIDGADDMHEDLTLTWADGTKDVITYHCSDHNEQSLSVNRWYKLNGKLEKGSLITIVK